MRNKSKARTMAIVIVLIAIYMGYLVAGCTDDAGTLSFESVISTLPSRFNKPIGLYFTRYTPIGVLFGGFIGVYIAVYYYLSQKKWMWGQEYGSAEWGDVKKISKKLAPPRDKDGKYTEPSRIYSQNLRISLNPDRTHLNNNVIVVAGSGKGKTLNLIIPNILECSGSMIITDPKKELLRTCGKYLLEKGYEIRVVDLIDFEFSDHYNPFKHTKSSDDIPELVELIWRSKADPKAQKGDPIWEDSAKALVESIFYYLFLEKEAKYRTFRNVMRILTYLSSGQKNVESWRKKIIEPLQEKNPDHPAATKYIAAMSGAEDTVKSVLFSATGRMASFYDEKLLRILDEDDMDFAAMGMGYENDKTKPTALFFCIPDADTRWNFIVSLAYMQAFKELYYAADHYCEDRRGALPIPVTNFLDEFANIPLPDTFPDLLSTMRGRNISAVIVLQDPSQLEFMYEKKKNTVKGNCDVTLYLGGSEDETHKWVSERLGTGTIDKRSTGRSYGSSGSESRNDDVLGRELMKADEIGRLLYNEIVIFVSGYHPIKDTKYPTLTSASYQRARSLGNYRHVPKEVAESEKSAQINVAEEIKNAGKNQKASDASKLTNNNETAKMKKIIIERATESEIKNADPSNVHTLYTEWRSFSFSSPETKKLFKMELFKGFSAEQLTLIKTAFKTGLTSEQLLSMLNPEMSIDKMKVVLRFMQVEI